MVGSSTRLPPSQHGRPTVSIPGVRARVGDMFVPGLVASDLDGTLLDSEHRVSARTLAALAALRRRGVPLVLVTGRPRRWLTPVLEQTGPVGPVVCANGSLVVDERNEHVLAEWPIPANVLGAT